MFLGSSLGLPITRREHINITVKVNFSECSWDGSNDVMGNWRTLALDLHYIIV